MKDRLEVVEGKVDKIETDVKDVKDRLEVVEGKVNKIETDVKIIKIDSLENRVIPGLKTIESCYVDASKRYIASADRFETAISDIDVMKKTIQNHSVAIQELQMKQA